MWVNVTSPSYEAAKTKKFMNEEDDKENVHSSIAISTKLKPEFEAFPRE